MGALTATLPDVRETALTALDPSMIAAALGRVLPGTEQMPVVSFSSSI